MYCSVLQCAAVYVAVCCRRQNKLRQRLIRVRASVCCSVMQRVATKQVETKTTLCTHIVILYLSQLVLASATRYNTLRHVATRCNTLIRIHIVVPKKQDPLLEYVRVCVDVCSYCKSSLIFLLVFQ